MQRNETRLCMQARTRIISGKFVGLRLGSDALRDRYAIDRTQQRREERFSGREEIAIITVLRQQKIDDAAQRLLLRVLRNLHGPFGVNLRVLRERIEEIELQHVAEEGAQTVCPARRLDHPVTFT